MQKTPAKKFDIQLHLLTFHIRLVQSTMPQRMQQQRLQSLHIWLVQSTSYATKNKMAKLLALNYLVELPSGYTNKLKRRKEQYHARRNRDYICI